MTAWEVALYNTIMRQMISKFGGLGTKLFKSDSTPGRQSKHTQKSVAHRHMCMLEHA